MGIDWVKWRWKLLVGVVVLTAAAVAFVASPDDEQLTAEAVASGTSMTSPGSSTSLSSSTVPTTSAAQPEQEPTSSTTTASTTTTTTAPPVVSDEQTSGNLTARATIDPGMVTPSQFVEFSTHITDSDGTGAFVVWDFGDGRSTQLDGYAPGCGPAPETKPIEVTDVQQHAYRLPGRYRAVATVYSKLYGQACLSPQDEQVNVAVEVVVEDGPTYSNGPQQPSLRLGDWTRDHDQVRLYVQSFEDDGYIEGFWIDWGDGTEPEQFTDTMHSCTDPETTWDDSFLWTTLEHDYATPGDYQVTVTVRSAGCDGADQQQVQDTITLRWPPADTTTTSDPP